MSKLWVWLLILSLAMGIVPVAGAQEEAEPPRNIILFGWDGAQRNHIYECLGREELPNLKQLASEGALVDIDILGVTDTKAGWSQILTGYNPEVTGVYSNGRYQPVPKDLSIFERLEKHFGADDFVTVAVIGKRGHCGEIDPPRKMRVGTEAEKKIAKAKNPKGKIIEEDGVKYRFIPGSPYYNMYTALEVWEFGLTLDEKVGSRALQLLEKYKDKPFFFFVHFAEVDSKGHKHGENSKEYNGALISNDLWTGKIMAKLKELGLYDKTLIYVTADHGFDEGQTTHRDAPYVFLGTNDPKVTRRGERADVAPTILARFGLSLDKLEPQLNGSSLTSPGKSKAVGSRKARTTTPRKRKAANPDKSKANNPGESKATPCCCQPCCG
ncbi:MAG: alkaline phosphatase family protein [Phycisphaerae bacterium]